ncbi:recombinase RecB, partial [Actinosynnema sp. NPDC023658]
MTSQVQLDAGVVTRCRRRVHLEHDPTMREVPTLPPDPTGQQRKADANEHRRAVATSLGRAVGSDLMEIPHDVPSADRERVTAAAMQAGVPYIWGAALPRDPLRRAHARRQLQETVWSGHVPWRDRPST